MKKYSFVLVLIFAIQPLRLLADSATIYKWMDANGNVNFSDKPHDGAEEVQIPNAQTYSVPKTPTHQIVEEAKSDKKEHKYKISIAQPEDQATIRNPQGYVSVMLDLKPNLRKGNQIQLLLDDNPFGSPQETMAFELQDVKRGSHTLAAQVLDGNGKVITTSEQATFYMMPPRVGMAPR